MREQRRQMAAETVAALECCSYPVSSGRRVDFGPALAACVAQTRCYLPEALTQLETEVRASGSQSGGPVIEVTQETTLQASARLAQSGDWRRVGVLNFASARNPGGGFQSGAQAQEESLARASGLYPSLLACPDFYDAHRREASLLYSDRMIHSPGCPVFRSDDGQWLEAPYTVDFITSPAPNAGALRDQGSPELAAVPDTLRRRGGLLLALMAHVGCDALVLGAWGCGVFGNDPHDVAQAFAQHLDPGSPLAACFDLIVFAVHDTTPTRATLRAFQAVFG